MMIPGVRLTMAYVARLASFFCFKAEQIQKAEKRLSDAKASELLWQQNRFGYRAYKGFLLPILGLIFFFFLRTWLGIGASCHCWDCTILCPASSVIICWGLVAHHVWQTKKIWQNCVSKDF